ncbi:MAG: cation diffusion facilitator family transporter [Gemmatimonadaceae bacterium]
MTTAPPTDRGIRTTQLGLLVNATLAIAKLIAGFLGNSYALIADGVESTADVLSSLIVWGGLRVASREPDEDYPFGYGRAETLAGAVVAILLIGAAVGIAIEAVIEIRTPHHAPASWTLVVLVVVILVKWILSRRVHGVATDIGSHAVEADAWHHRSDALTSAAAFVGISIALWGGPGWESADDWAALAASTVILFNGAVMVRRASAELMDRTAGDDVLRAVRDAAERVEGVLATEKLAVRKTGLQYRVTVHVQGDPTLSLHDAHVLGGIVKSAIRRHVPKVQSVLVHMEPYGGGRGETGDGRRETGDRTAHR